MHVEGLIPLISAIVHPRAVTFCLRTCTSFSSCSFDSLLEMMTGKVSFSPRKAYFKCSGSCLSSITGACYTEGRSFSLSRVSRVGRLAKGLPEESNWARTWCISSDKAISNCGGLTKLFSNADCNSSIPKTSKVSCTIGSLLTLQLVIPLYGIFTSQV